MNKEDVDEMRTLTINVSSCEDCPYYRENIYTSPVVTRVIRGLCEITNKTDREDDNPNFIWGCPYKPVEEAK